jgi:chromosome partitioning protein
MRCACVVAWNDAARFEWRGIVAAAMRYGNEGVMHTIVLATQKGGTGKSSLAIGLAVAAMQNGHVVRMIETDRQCTLANWRRRRPNAEPVVEAITGAGDMERRLHIFDRSGVTLTVIDTAGGMNPMTTAAIRAADLCLIPARPSLLDIEATAPTLSTIRAFDRPFCFVLNQTPLRSHRIDDAANSLGSAATALDLAGLVAQPYITMRNDHQDALGKGLAVTEFAPAGRSAEEMRRLWQWVERRLTSVAPGLAVIRNLPSAA